MKPYDKQLVLENGKQFFGYGFGADKSAINEIVFNTSMVGYQEIVSDPSYTDQMVVMTYPLIGNYGITAEDMESGRVHMRALLVKECCKEPSNWRSKESLPDFLKRWNVPGMEGLDTRALTRHLRINGAMRGIISTRDLDVESLRAKACALPSMEGQNLVPFVAAQKPYILTADGPKDAQFDANGAYAWQGTGIPLLVYDFGVKWNILRLLAEVGFEPLAVPPSFTPDQARASGAKGVFLSNGPGDPAEPVEVIENLKHIFELNIPTFGICLGHQLSALAAGAKTMKLKYGHRGANQPVTDFESGRTFITSQNHGYAVVGEELPAEMGEVAQVNANDGTCEGIKYKKWNCFTVQFHPEANGGPKDTEFLFDRFLNNVKAAKEAR